MRSTLGASAALLLAFSAMFLQSMVLPARAVACSCAPPRPLADVVARGEWAVLVGAVEQRVGDRLPVLVEAWFHGDQPTDVIWLSGGFGDDGACDVLLQPGEQRFLVVHTATLPYSTNSCVPGATLDTAEGQALVAEATATFGTPRAPPTPEPEPERPVDLSPYLGEGIAWVIGGLGGALVVFGVIVLAARRRRLS